MVDGDEQSRCERVFAPNGGHKSLPTGLDTGSGAADSNGLLLSSLVPASVESNHAPPAKRCAMLILGVSFHAAAATLF